VIVTVVVDVPGSDGVVEDDPPQEHASAAHV
jgi:hypothetical protein